MKHLRFTTAVLICAVASFVATCVAPIAHAQWMSPAFWKQHDFTVDITSGAVSGYAGDCYGIYIQSENWLHSPTGVKSALTINLSSAPGVVFYSDNTCTQNVTSVTIPTGSHAVYAYFVYPSAGSPTITASVTANYYYPTSTSQTETVSSNPFVWTGGGADANWTTAANWSGGAVPGSTNVALFDGTCTSNCSPTINANTTVGGIRMAAGYTGTITQGSGYSLTLGTSGSNNLVEMAGTFTGSSGGITNPHDFAISGGTFTAGAQTITESGNWTVFGGTLNMSGSTLDLAASNTETYTPSTAAYDNVEFAAGAVQSINGTMAITGSVTLDKTGGNLNSGTLDIAGNVSLTAGAALGGTTWVFDGSGTQTISGSGEIGGVDFDSTGTVSVQNDLTVGGNWTYTAGTVNLNGYAVTFDGSHSIDISPGSVPFNGVTFTISGCCDSITVGGGTGTMTVNGTLTLNSDGYGWTGTIDATGNININGGSGNNNGALVIDGSGTQTIAGTTSGVVGSLQIASTGNVDFTGTMQIAASWTYSSGTINIGTTAVVFKSGGNFAVNPGSMAFYDVTIDSWGCCQTVTASTPMNITHSLTVTQVNSGMVGTYDVAGNLTLTSNGGGSASIVLNGTAAQTVSGSGAWPSGGITDSDTSATVTQSSAMSDGGSSSLTLSSSGAAWNMAGYALTVNSLNLNGGTLTKNGGVLTVGGTVVGTGSLYGGTVNP